MEPRYVVKGILCDVTNPALRWYLWNHVPYIPRTILTLHIAPRLFSPARRKIFHSLLSSRDTHFLSRLQSVTLSCGLSDGAALPKEHGVKKPP